jgi:hypothetical protein
MKYCHLSLNWQSTFFIIFTKSFATTFCHIYLSFPAKYSDASAILYPEVISNVLAVFESASIKFHVCYRNLMDNLLELKFSCYLSSQFDLNSQG